MRRYPNTCISARKATQKHGFREEIQNELVRERRTKFLHFRVRKALPTLQFLNEIACRVGIFPHKAKGEGLFMAVLKRVKEVRPAVIKKVQIPIVSPPREIKLGEGLVTIRDKKLHAFPEAYLSYIHHLSNIKTHAVGSVLGEQKGRAFFPDHEVATALQISHAFPHVDVDRNTALSYLKKETFKVDGPEGQIVISYNGHPLGWAKNVGTRINNHYPVSWRLRG